MIGLGNVNCNCCGNDNCPCCCLNQPGDYKTWQFDLSFHYPPGAIAQTDLSSCGCLVNHSPYRLKYQKGGPLKDCGDIGFAQGGFPTNGAPVYWTRPSNVNYSCGVSPNTFAILIQAQINVRPNPYTGQDKCCILLGVGLNVPSPGNFYYINCGDTTWTAASVNGLLCPMQIGFTPAPPPPDLGTFICATQKH